MPVYTKKPTLYYINQIKSLQDLQDWIDSLDPERLAVAKASGFSATIVSEDPVQVRLTFTHERGGYSQEYTYTLDVWAEKYIIWESTWDFENFTLDWEPPTSEFLSAYEPVL